MRRRRLQIAALVAVSLLLSVLLAEVVLRALGPDPSPSSEWRHDPFLGWVHHPGQRYVYTVDGEEVEVAYNSSGFRDIEHARRKHPGVRRVVVLGDSFSAAVEVNLADTFARRLEKLLDAGSRESWEVVNLGIADFGTAQQYLALEHYGLAYEPDVVVHQIFPLNDVCNNSLDLAGLCKSPNDHFRPYFVESGEDLRPASTRPVRTFLRRRLRIYRMAEKAYLRLGHEGSQVDEAEYARRVTAAGLPPLAPLLYTYVAPEEQIEPVARGWRVTERLVARIAGRCSELGIGYLPVVIPFHARLAEAWDAFAAAQPPPAMIRDYPERRLSSLFERLGVSSLLLLDLFERRRDLVLPTRGGHLNPGAHDLVARAIYQRMAENGWLEEAHGESPALGRRTEATPATRGDAELAWDESIELGSVERARDHLLDGWGEPAGTHVWTVGRRAVLAVPAPPGPGPMTVTLTLNAFLVPGRLERQRVRVLAGGEPLSEWTLTEPGFHDRAFEIPADRVAGRRWIEVVLETPDAVSPAALGVSPDERVLGIAVAALALSRQP